MGRMKPIRAQTAHLTLLAPSGTVQLSQPSPPDSLSPSDSIGSTGSTRGRGIRFTFRVAQPIPVVGDAWSWSHVVRVRLRSSSLG